MIVWVWSVQTTHTQGSRNHEIHLPSSSKEWRFCVRCSVFSTVVVVGYGCGWRSKRSHFGGTGNAQRIRTWKMMGWCVLVKWLPNHTNTLQIYGNHFPTQPSKCSHYPSPLRQMRVIYYHLGQYSPYIATRQSYTKFSNSVECGLVFCFDHRLLSSISVQANAQRMGLTLLWRCNDSLMCPSPNRRGSSLFLLTGIHMCVCVWACELQGIYAYIYIVIRIDVPMLNMVECHWRRFALDKIWFWDECTAYVWVWPFITITEGYKWWCHLILMS